MELSFSQKEMKEPSEEQDSRGGGLPCPDETSVWRSLNKAGMGDALKSPKMGVTNWHFSRSFHFYFLQLTLMILLKTLSYHQSPHSLLSISPSHFVPDHQENKERSVLKSRRD